MEWATSRPSFKTRLFRFVDVVPVCRSDADTAAHLAEYLQHADSPRSVRAGLRLMGRLPGGDRLAAGAATFGIRKMARQFIIGDRVDEVVDGLTALWVDGFATTLDLLGEKTITDADADAYARRVDEALAALVGAAEAWPDRALLETDPWGRLPRINVSVKPSALSAKITNLTMAMGVSSGRGPPRTDPGGGQARGSHDPPRRRTRRDERRHPCAPARDRPQVS